MALKDPSINTAIQALHSNGIDTIRVALKGLDGGTRAGVPDAHRPIFGPRDDARAVRRKRDGIDPIRVALEGVDGGTRAGVPDAHPLIPGPRDDARAVRRKHDGVDRT